MGLDLDESQLPGATLAQGRRRAVRRQHIRIAVAAETRIVRVRVVPRAGGQLGHTRSYRIVEDQTGQTGTAIIDDPHNVTSAQPARGRVLRM